MPVILSEKNYLSLGTDCKFTSVLWEFNSESQRFQRTATIKPGRGYWIKTADSCTASASYTQKVTLVDYPIDISKGWNIVGSQFESIAFSEITNDCSVTAGPYWYNSDTRRYEIAINMEPGKGYIIRAGSACTLTPDGGLPPPLPLAAAVTRK